jgi:predicted unusual protein kinase regulating ubiquinone biosynthesis (AarF/ABC1/UbiB family)
VPSFPTREALATIEEELSTRGQSVGELFSDLDADTVPYAAASLGQVRTQLRELCVS